MSISLVGNQRRRGIKHDGETKAKISNTLKGMFSKEKNPNWKGGITDESQVIRHSDEYLKWRSLIYKRDKYQCRICNSKVGNNFNAHHSFSFALYPELRFDINNGVTICKKCHKLLHKIFGREPKVIPEKEWIDLITHYCRIKGIPVYLKNSLKNIYPETIKEFPKTGLKLF